MSKLAIQSTAYGFTVRQEQIMHDGRKLPFFGNFRTDNNVCLGMTSDHYGLVQNTELLDAAHAALDARGLTGYDEKIMVTGNGERFYATFEFKNKQLASAVGDVFGFKLTLKNSFDRSLRVAFELGFLRLACLNGMATMEKEFAATRKHSTKITIDFLADAIDRAMSRGKDALQVYDQMAQIALTDEQGKNVLAQLVARDLLSGKHGDSMTTLWLAPKREEDKARNLYNLYNAITEHLTHQVSGERFEYAAKVNNNVLITLVNAARNKDKLTKLLLPVPQPQTVVVVDTNAVAAAGGQVLEATIVQ